MAGYDVGAAAGYTQVANPLGVDGSCDRCDQPHRSVARPNQRLLDVMPVAYAVTYIFGTVDRHRIALIGPAMLGIDLRPPANATKRSTAAGGGRRPRHGLASIELRAFRVNERDLLSQRHKKPRRWFPDQRVFVQRIRQGGQIKDATADTVIHGGDVLAVAGRRDVLVSLLVLAPKKLMT